MSLWLSKSEHAYLQKLVEEDLKKKPRDEKWEMQEKLLKKIKEMRV